METSINEINSGINEKEENEMAYESSTYFLINNQKIRKNNFIEIKLKNKNLHWRTLTD